MPWNDTHSSRREPESTIARGRAPRAALPFSLARGGRSLFPFLRASIAPGGAAISRLARLAPQMVDEASLCYRASITKRGTSGIPAGDASCWPARTEISTAIGSGIGQRKAIDFFVASMSAPA